MSGKNMGYIRNIITLMMGLFMTSHLYAGNNNAYVGKKIIATMNVYDSQHSLIQTKKVAGIIKRFEKCRIVLSLLKTKQEYYLPPAQDYIVPATQYVYFLFNSNVHLVIKPDYELSLDINGTANHELTGNQVKEISDVGYIVPDKFKKSCHV